MRVVLLSPPFCCYCDTTLLLIRVHVVHAQVVVSTHVREGYRMLMQTSGLGGMQINTVVIPWMNVRPPSLR